MRTTNKMGYCILFIFVVLVMSQNVFGLGVTPAREIVYYEPGLMQTVEFNLINNENKEMEVSLYAQGSLADRIVLGQNSVKFGQWEDSKTISYTFILPEDIEPGVTETEIVAREIPNILASEGTFIGSTVAVIHQFHVMEPYPGKYVIARLKIAETGKSDSINFIVPVQNFGTLDISKVRAIIDIYGPTNEKITSIETSEVNLPVGSTIDLTADWAGVINFGKYSARLTVIYDGETTSVIEKVFSIGGASVGVLGIQVNDDFSLGEIAKFNILVESNWPESLNEVYTEMVVYDLDGKEITRFKSSTESIDSMGKEELIAYWDTAGVEKGEYRTNLIVHYDELTVSQDLRTEVSSNSIDFYLIDISGDVEKSGFKFSTTVILISVVAILIIGNIAWFVYFRKKKK